jgi:hypothetical protein
VEEGAAIEKLRKPKEKPNPFAFSLLLRVKRRISVGPGNQLDYAEGSIHFLRNSAVRRRIMNAPAWFGSGETDGPLESA